MPLKKEILILIVVLIGIVCTATAVILVGLSIMPPNYLENQTQVVTLMPGEDSVKTAVALAVEQTKAAEMVVDNVLTETPIQQTSTPTPEPLLSGTVGPRCVPATAEQINLIRSGIKGLDSSNDIKTGWVVKSNDYESVWMFAAKIYGPGMENGTGPAAWAISQNPDTYGMVFSVDDFAKKFSNCEDGSKSMELFTVASDGVADVLSCASND